MFVFSTFGIIFNCAPVQSLTAANRRRMDQYFQFQLYMEKPGHQMPVLILLIGLSKLGEQVHEIN